MHYFIDHLVLTNQIEGDTFGPDIISPAVKFNVTSEFQLTTEAKAFVCLSGQMIVQQSEVDPSLVNVIIEPRVKSNIPSGKIKYFIYRGIIKSGLLNGLNVAAKDPSNNELIARIYNAKPDINSYTASILGFDNNILPGNQNVNTIFLKGINDIKSMPVNEGEWFGNFTTAHKIGFEIITETDKIKVDLSFARKGKTVIDVTGLAGFDERIKREEILSFMDPAALWGIHHADGIKISTYSGGSKTTQKKKGNDIYTLLIVPFFTKNRVYLDVRSEFGYSYNLYQNYADSNGFNIKIGNSVNPPLAQLYATNNWPIIFTEEAATTSELRNNIKLSLRINDNLKPLVYYEDSTVIDSANSSFFIDEKELLITENDTEWTRVIAINFPNTGLMPEKDNVAYYLKMHYFRQENNPNSPDTVLLKEEMADNLFGPLDMPFLSDGNLVFQHTENQQPLLVFGELDPQPSLIDTNVPPSDNFTYVAKGGAYFDSDLTTFYTNVNLAKKQSHNPLAPQLVESFGLNIAGKFASQSFLAKDVLVTPVQIEETVTGGTQKVDILSLNAAQSFAKQTENVFFLGLTNTEVQALKSVPGFNTKHPKYLKIQKEESSSTDINGIIYQKGRLVVQGLDNFGKRVVEPTQIWIYSVTGYQWVSSTFSATADIYDTYFQQEPIIENGITYEKLTPSLAPNLHFRKIGESKYRGTVTNDDLRYDLDYGPYHKDIRKDVQDLEDFQLFNHLKVLFRAGTILDGAMFEAAEDFRNYFRTNTSNESIMRHPTVNDRVANSSKYINYIKTFGADFQKKLRLVNGNVNNIPTVVKPSESRPVFNQKNYDMVHGLTILVNDTIHTEIRLEEYNYNPITKAWSAIIVVEISDHFGVDAPDVVPLQYDDKKYGVGFAAWWVLQHRRAYVPFITKINTRCRITGTLQGI